MLRKLLCWLGIHRPRPDVDPEWSIAWDCRTCGQVMPGALATKRRRP